MHYRSYISPLRYLFCVIFCIATGVSRAQQQAENLLLQNYEQAKTDSEKVYTLYPLINYYYAFNIVHKADSLRELQLIFAQENGSQTLVLGTFFPVYDNVVMLISGNERFNKELSFANQALEYAQSHNLDEYIALAYSRIAAVYRKSGQPDLAAKNADIAFSTALRTKNDSVKVVTALEMGDVFMQKKDLVMAFRKFSNAFDIANNLQNNYLLSAVYYHFTNLYNKLKSTENLNSREKAKEYILKSIALNTQYGNIKGLIKDYITIAKIVDITPAKNYLERAALLADSIQDPVLKLQIDQTMFDQHMINDGSENTFAFLRSHPDVEIALRNAGDHKYEWEIGEIFLYGKKYDSAYVHFKRAEPAFNASYNISGRINFYTEFADCCKGLGLSKEAIQYFTTTLDLATAALNMRERYHCLDELQRLYYEVGDYKKAYEYANSYNLLQDSVNALNKVNDLVRGEIENENRRILKENELAQLSLLRKHDAQYMLITITVAIAFVLLVLLGLFTVSATTIRVLGFFSFIFLFELITLLLDKWIHDKTHGEPGKIWLIKIAIISLMFPLHHWLEHKLIHYLLNKKLIHVGSFFSFRKLFRHRKIQAVPVEVTETIADNSEDMESTG